MIAVTQQAAEKLKAIIEEEGTKDAALKDSSLRVLVVPSGHGVQYMLTLEKELREDDITLETDGVRLVVDRDSAPILEGARIDYVEDLMRSGFVISNPNIQMGGGCACGGGQCGCGGHQEQ